MSSTIPPSPTPPWARPVQNPETETFTEAQDNQVLSLECDVTFLSASVLKNPANNPYVARLPHGNFIRQQKRIYIRGEDLPTTAPWKVTGTFADCGFLLLTAIGTSAVLEWDGTTWQLMAGNAEKAS